MLTFYLSTSPRVDIIPSAAHSQCNISLFFSPWIIAMRASAISGFSFMSKVEEGEGTRKCNACKWRCIYGSYIYLPFAPWWINVSKYTQDMKPRRNNNVCRLVDVAFPYRSLNSRRDTVQSECQNAKCTWFLSLNGESTSVYTMKSERLAIYAWVQVFTRWQVMWSVHLPHPGSVFGDLSDFATQSVPLIFNCIRYET